MVTIVARVARASVLIKFTTLHKSKALFMLADHFKFVSFVPFTGLYG